MARNANGLGSMYFDKSVSRWKYVISLGRDESGKVVRKTFTGKTQREAKKKYNQFMETYDGLDYLSVKDYTLGSWLDEFRLLHYPSIKSSTQWNYDKSVRFWKSTDLVDCKLVDLNRMTLQRFVNYYHRTNTITWDRLKFHSNFLRMVLAYRMKMDLLTKNPAINLTFGRSEIVSTKKTIDPETDRVLLDYFSSFPDIEEYTIPIMILYFTGMRCGELLALTESDIDFENMTISINKTLSETPKEVTSPKTQSSIRVIPLPRNLVEPFRILIESSSGSRIVNIRYKALSDRNLKFLKHLGVEYFSLHTYRHNYSTKLASAGVPLTVVRDLLGHSDIAMTAGVYTHTSLNSMFDATDLLLQNCSK